MIDNDEVLESMQADILGILQHTPSLKGHVFKDTEGDFNSRLEKSLGTKTAGSTGKRGLAIIVLQIDVTEAEKNLPGPPLNLRVRVLIIENIVINRSATRGTLQRSSQAALNILNTLQLSQLGSYALYADKAPLAPQTVPEGLSSHMVTLYVRSGMNPVSKPLAVQAAMAGAVRITGSLTNGTNPITFPDLLFDQVVNGGDYYVATISGGLAELVFSGTVWLLQYSSTFPNQSAFWSGSGNANTLPENITWTPEGSETGTPILARVAGNVQLITLTCDSPSSSIRYTTDGSYPSPAKTLYTTPLTGLAVGTVVRAAAYVAGMPPGDVLEFTVAP